MSLPPLDLSQCGFVVQKWIGHCWFGEGDVFTARCNDAISVVVKRMSVEHANPDAVMKEVGFLRSLRHQNVTGFHSSFVHQTGMFIALPKAIYGSVLDIILSSYDTGIPERAIATILAQLCKGISYIHNQGIVHRSIRCSHILIADDGCIKITGFRCSIRLPNEERRRLTDFEKELEGSILWLAPEVLAQDMHGYGRRSDIYSIGISLCEMANGFPPFMDMVPLQMLYEKGRGTTPKLLDRTTLHELDDSALNKREFSEAFHDITEKCLQSNQFHRPDASRLLDHPFLCRRKKKHLLDTLPLIRQLDEVDRISEKPEVVSPHLSAPSWN